MYTIVETAVFVRYAAEVWTEEELDLFKIWIANNPLSGDVIQGTGGARVIYYNKLTDGVIALLIVYTKAKFDNLPAAFLARLKKEFEDAQES